MDSEKGTKVARFLDNVRWEDFPFERLNPLIEKAIFCQMSE